MFPVTSRYYNIEVATMQSSDGRTVSYLHRRFLPSGTPAIALATYTVIQDDRLDNVTARYLGDPEQFWRVCDANNAMRPDDLTDESQIGHSLIIPLPQGGR
jgi:hypothetical protein